MMAAGGTGAVLKSIQDLIQAGALVGLSDAELLEWFVYRDGACAEAAFAVLVERHGPMVLQVCRTLLGDVHEADDAFQATFLVLARKAGSLRTPGLLANWLYGVAHRTARKARTQARRRRSREAREDAMSALEVIDRGDPHDLALVHREQAGLIHEELERLAEKHRAVVVLCGLEGLTVEETARRLGCTPGAVRGRLADARARLKTRLARRGVVVPAAVVAATLSAQAASAALTPALKEATTRAALQFVGKVAASGAASATAAATARSVSRLMLLPGPKLGAALLALAVAGAGLVASTRVPSHRAAPKAHPAGQGRATRAVAPAPGPDDPRRFIEGLDWMLSAVDPDRGTIDVEAGKGRIGKPVISLIQFRGRTVQAGLSLDGLKVAADAQVIVDGRPSRLEQLRDVMQVRDGMQVDLGLAPDRLIVTTIRAQTGVPAGPLFAPIVEAVDPARATLSFSVADRTHRLEAIRVAPGAEIRRFHARPDDAIRLSRLDLEDVRPGTPASIGLNAGEDGRLYVRSMSCAVDGDGEEKSR